MFLFFFFNATATTEIYTLSLHDALPISRRPCAADSVWRRASSSRTMESTCSGRSEEHTSELQSHSDLVCRLLLEKKKKKKKQIRPSTSEVKDKLLRDYREDAPSANVSYH